MVSHWESALPTASRLPPRARAKIPPGFRRRANPNAVGVRGAGAVCSLGCCRGAGEQRPSGTAEDGATGMLSEGRSAAASEALAEIFVLWVPLAGVMTGDRASRKQSKGQKQRRGLAESGVFYRLLKGFLKEAFEKRAACTSEPDTAFCCSRASPPEGPTAGGGEKREFLIRNQKYGPRVWGDIWLEYSSPDGWWGRVGLAQNFQGGEKIS